MESKKHEHASEDVVSVTKMYPKLDTSRSNTQLKKRKKNIISLLCPYFF